MERKRVKNEGFVGLQLTPDVLKKLDAKVKSLKLATGSGSRSAVIRMAIIYFLSRTENEQNS